MYRSLEEIEPQRRLNQLKTKRWFKPLRGGARIVGNKDYPTNFHQEHRKSPGNKWKIPTQKACP